MRCLAELHQFHQPGPQSLRAIVTEVDDIRQPLLAEHRQIASKDVAPMHRRLDQRQTPTFAARRHQEAATGLVQKTEPFVAQRVEPMEPPAELLWDVMDR